MSATGKLDVRKNIAMGYQDSYGAFHPIRASKDYNEFRTTDVESPSQRRGRIAKRHELYSRDYNRQMQLAGKQAAKRYIRKHRVKSLSQFVRAAGGMTKGILPGEVSRLSRKESGTTGLINEKARRGYIKQTAEHLMDAANVEGYRDRFGAQFENIGDFLLAVEDDVSGARKHYSLGDLEEMQSTLENPSHSQEVAGTILQQLGGRGRLTAMIGARDFLAVSNGLSFKFKGSQAYNYARIVLNSSDLYDVTLLRLRGGAPKRIAKVKTFENVHVADLRKVIEEATGLYLSLGTMGNARARTALSKAKNPTPVKITRTDLAKFSPAARAKIEGQMRAAESEALAEKAKAKRKHFRVSWYSPLRGKRSSFMKPIVASSATDAKSQARRMITNDKGATNFIAEEVAILNPRNPKGSRPGLLPSFRENAKKKNMHALQVGSHLAAIAAGLVHVKKLASKPKKQRRPTAGAAGKRLAQRRHGHVTGRTRTLRRAIKNSTGKGKHNFDLVGAVGTLQAAEYLQKEFSAKKKKKRNAAAARNPNNESLRRIFKEFHGLPNSGEVFRGIAPAGTPKDLAMLGDLRLVKLSNGRTQSFPRGFAQLGAAQQGNIRRIYIVQASPFKVPGALQNSAPHNYGEISQIEYEASKPHLYGTDRPFLFYHKLGEEGGKRPELVLQNGCFLPISGDYKIQREGIRN